ncbi:chalcone isomerase family protein [Pseudomonas aegrilactucae]|uniref:Chalcone isomerase family protein n=1 Tax=Pseudomonas aegrilactucae TaxID=2854028 RepID=A0A9Q2XK65_9PSED|nr:chalcone isomerase family protein [Pseudomonas aegrilactucae]MBV6288193.1 chalcone isomerase family protein [Pseudomonas aegrilactucae]
MRPTPFALCRLLLLCTLAGGQAVGAWQEALPDARLIGSGELKVWGLSLYSARLWSAGPGFDQKKPFALEITYHRAVSRERLVSISLEEIQRLSGDSVSTAQLRQWQAQMQQAFVDVQAGERITGVYLPGQGCRFYVGQRLQHTVRDEAFARAFFALWLDPRSRNPELRQQLLGGSS